MPTRWILCLAALLPALPNAGPVIVGEPPIPAPYQEAARDVDTTWSPERAALGKRLFQDTRLSKDNTVSCGTCHRPDLAFTDGSKVGVGIRGQKGGRNTPTIVNRSLGERHFWDGRAASLEEQALGPIANPKEMDLPVEEAVARLAADPSYRADFKQAFQSEPTAAGVAAAIAAYERTLYSVDAPFDRFLAGDQAALNASAQRGLKLFGEKAKCGECHTGVNFTDELFHSIGVKGDRGRGAVTGDSKDEGTFKTPTLREIALTAPYMHDGSLATLAEVVDYYDEGGRPHPNLDPKVQKLDLTAQEKADLVAFMDALSGTVIEASVPVAAREARQ